MWTINIFPEKGGDTSLRNTILDANKDRSSSNADTRLVNTSLLSAVQKTSGVNVNLPCTPKDHRTEM